MAEGSGGDELLILLPRVDSTTLVEDDLFDVLESLSPVASKWKAIGTALRIKRSKLEEIERNHKAEMSECLADAITEYLHQCYDVQKHGEPTWQNIVKAVQHQAGGNNRALALSIAREHVAAHHSVSFAGEQDSQSTDDEGYTHLLEKLSQKLRSQLEVLHSLSVKCDEDEHLKSRNIKKALSDFIETTTQSKISPDSVRKVLAKMYGSDLLVDNDIYEWALNEVASTEKESSKPAVEVLDNPEDKLPPLFCKDTVYHACLCSYATSTRTAANYRDFFSKDFPQHSLEEASLSRSQDKEDVDRYLIARQGKTFYVTFQSEPFLSEWMKKFSSFEEGIRIQSERIPLRFFVRLMHDGYRIIFAGFSFGGLLAMSVAAFLWKQPLLSVDLLQENVACISIGAPIINLSTVAEVMEETPQFGNTVHSILLDSDPIPRLMTFLDPRCEEVCTEILLGTSQPNTLESLQAFQGMFTSQLARHLGVLQEMGLSKGTDVDAANALSTIKSLLCKVLPHLLARNYSKQITMGSVYSVVKDPLEGVVFKGLQKEELPLHTEFPTLPDIDQLSLEMFSKHNAETYNNSVFRSFIKKASEPRPPLCELSIVKPSTKSIAFHRYGKEVSVTVNGDNLWFCYHIQVGPHKKKVLAKDTSQRSLQFNYDPEDESKMSSDIDNVKVTLCSHFCNPMKDGKVEVTHKVYRFSFRQEQLAKLTPSELIGTAYMSALLEQHPHKRQKHFSHRFDTVRNFLAQIVSVVPVETIVHTIGHCDDQNIANKCTDLLIASQLEFPPSLLFLHGINNAFSAQVDGAPKNIAQKEHLELITYLTRKLSFSSKKQVAHKLYQQQIEQSTGSEHPAGNIINREALYVQTAAGLCNGHVSEKDSLLIAQRKLPNHPRLEQIAKLLYIITELAMKSQSCGELDALSGLKLKVVYPTTSRNVLPSTKESQVKTPLDILSEGRRSLSWLAQQMVSSETTRAESETLKEEQQQQLSQLYNSKMLSVVNEIRTNDLRMCTSLLGAFMEEQIRVPLVKSEFNTARALNTLLSATAVGVWAMFSLTLGDMDAVIKSIPSRSLLVQVKEYIKGIFKEKSASADKNYAGKLQFMVQGMDKTVSCNSHYVSYSLKRQLLELCKKLNISESTPLEMLVKDWDRLFKDDVLSLVVPTHRSLIASWMKWALMMHNLREELAKYTTVGVVGLVNSGKSLLVSTLFNIEVPVGTTAVKRTTVPFLYNLEGVIEGLDVIDFPGVDDRDDTIPELCELLLALAQVVIFVVDYRKAHTQSAKQWLEMLEDKSVPVLVCLTYADKLYAEHMGKNGSYPEVSHIQQRVSEECLMIEEQLGRVPSHDVKFFSFSQDRDSVLNSPEGRERLKGAGVGSPQEVGDWLAHVFESQLDQDDVAKQLKTFVYREDTHKVE